VYWTEVQENWQVIGGLLPVPIYIVFKDWLVLKMSPLSIKDEYKK